MKRFNSIDDKLKLFASNHNTVVQTKGSSFGIGSFHIPSNKVEERRICWTDGMIGKAIFILPNFNSNNIDSPTWDLINLAWLDTGKSGQKNIPFWEKYLLQKAEFQKIEQEIDSLLMKSTENLATIRIEDLRPG